MSYRPCPGPTTGPCPRLLEFARELKRRDPTGRNGGIFNPRKIAGKRTWSVHACGRAIDWFPTNRGAGAVLASWLAGPYGPADVQAVLWDGWSWRRRKIGPNWRRIPAKENQHKDHLHIESNQCAA